MARPAGKSTLLDALCLAAHDATPRLNQVGRLAEYSPAGKTGMIRATCCVEERAMGLRKLLLLALTGNHGRRGGEFAAVVAVRMAHYKASR
ncbi:MAG: hypothetical protein U0936_03590 [Planctomycetaceae bacterium]